MPNLPTHMSLAYEVASRVDHPIIQGHLGGFLLGSTSPDIRIMTKWKRDRTHFTPLSVERVGAGIRGLWAAHPELADSARLGDETRAFLSGYFTHLVSDETWIVNIYRPYFDGQDDDAGRMMSNLWDRAVQLDMDRTAWDGLGGIDRVRKLLEGSESGVGVEFIDAETLAKWREWVTEFIGWEFTWDRLRFATRRMYRDDAGAMEMADKFLESIPRSLEEVYDKIPGETFVSYREGVVRESVNVVKEYLGEPESN